PPSSTLFPYTTLFRSDDEQIRLRVRLVLIVEQLAGAAEAGLDLVEDQEHVVPSAELADLRQIARRRHDNARLRLDRLEHERDRRSEEHTSELQSRENL